MKSGKIESKTEHHLILYKQSWCRCELRHSKNVHCLAFTTFAFSIFTNSSATVICNGKFDEFHFNFISSNR